MRRISCLAVVLALQTAVHAQLAPEVRLELTGGGPMAEFGAFVGTVGDLDGDGLAEVLTGAPFDSVNGIMTGSVSVHSGASGALIHHVTGETPFQQLGCYVAGLSDVNGDGWDDFVAGLCGDGTVATNAGGARVFSGADGSVLFTVFGSSAAAQAGFSVAGAGDVNGDGTPDVLVGAPGFFSTVTFPGRVRVHSGVDGSVLHTFVGAAGGDRFGFSVSPAGDVNGDGYADVLVGAIGHGAHAGRAYVYSGVNGAVLHVFDGDLPGDELGHGTSAAGDLDQDGFDDVFVAADRRPGTSYARVYSGATGQVLLQMTGGGDFGHSCALVGDANGDGVQDFAVGAPADGTAGPAAGAVRIFSGATGLELASYFGAAAQDRYGYVVSGGRDLNGDGLTEVIVGSSALDLSDGYARAVSVAAAERYGVGSSPTTTLDLALVTGLGATPSAGLLTGSGGLPFGTGLVVFSTARASRPALGVEVLVDTDEILIFGFFGFGPTGGFAAPLNLRQPLLSGFALYTQFFDFDPSAPQGIFASNGLLTLFGG